MNEYKPPEITRRLAEISRVMNDPYTFVHLRFAAEQWAKEDDESSKTLIGIIDKFYSLCVSMELSDK